jgi:glycosyltransferase involved in cell wall biosynthesis
MSQVKFISVLIPCFNVEKTIERALDSVKNQEWPVPYEVICINNNSSDRTQEVIKEWQEKNKLTNFKLLFQPFPGIVPTLNIGIFSLANICDLRNHFIARQDGDDEWLPDKIKKQIKEIDEKNLDIVGCQYRVLDKNTKKLKYITNHPIDDNEIKLGLFTNKNFIPHPAVVYRRSIFLRIGIYDDLFKYAEDMWLWSKAIKYFKFGNVNEILLNYYHEHNQNYDSQIINKLSFVLKHLP